MNQEIQPVFEVDAMRVALGRTPDPEVAALPKCRQFSAAYKRRIVREANACQVPGEVGALLRREGLYSSHLTHWRREVEGSENAALAPKPRGPKPDLAKAESRRNEALEREVARLRHKLERASRSSRPKKNYANCWGCPWTRNPRDEQRQGGRPADRHRGCLHRARGGPCDVLPRAASGVGAAGQCPACILAPGAERTGTAHDPRVAAPTGLRGLEPPHRVRHAARCGSLPRLGVHLLPAATRLGRDPRAAQ